MEKSANVGEKLDALVRLTAVAVLGEKKGGEAIAVLAKAGLDNKLIAELLDTTEATVRAARSKMKKRKGS